MKSSDIHFFLVLTVMGVSFAAYGQQESARVCTSCIRAHMEFLASDALRGRGSATHDELVAATYIASELRAYRVDPAGDAGGYVQRALRSQAARPLSGILAKSFLSLPWLRKTSQGDCRRSTLIKKSPKQDRTLSPW